QQLAEHGVAVVEFRVVDEIDENGARILAVARKPYGAAHVRPEADLVGRDDRRIRWGHRDRAVRNQSPEGQTGETSRVDERREARDRRGRFRAEERDVETAEVFDREPRARGGQSP